MNNSTPPPEALIMGAGVLALSTATLLQNSHPKIPITLIASEFPSPSPMSQSHPLSPSQPKSELSTPSYASMWAGAHYRPIPFIPATHPSFSTLEIEQQAFHRQLAKERSWALKTATRMMKVARSTPNAGVKIVEGEELLEEPPEQNLLLRSGDVYACEGDGFRVWEGREVEELNERVGGEGTGKVKWAASYKTYVVNPHVYTAHLLSNFTEHGGRTVRCRLNSLTDALGYVQPGHKAVIVNCTGTGLVSDPNSTLIRGQTLLVRKPYHKTVTRQCQDGTWSFLIPRPLGGGTIVGGTKQVGDTHGSSRPEERSELLANAARYFPEFVGSGDKVGEEDIVCDNVGFRPARKGGVRVEREDIDTEDGKLSIIHGYGAGGRGYEISWGVAEEVSDLVGVCLSDQQQEVERSRL